MSDPQLTKALAQVAQFVPSKHLVSFDIKATKFQKFQEPNMTEHS